EAADALEPAGEGELGIAVALTIDGDQLELDFAGTADQYKGNLNCPLAVTRSACYFVVRCLTDPDVPASGGAFVPVRVVAPDGSLVNARAPAAVAAGRFARECPRPGGRGRRECRDLEPDSGRRLRGLRPGRARARAGPGDDE